MRAAFQAQRHAVAVIAAFRLDLLDGFSELMQLYAAHKLRCVHFYMLSLGANRR